MIQKREKEKLQEEEEGRERGREGKALSPENLCDSRSFLDKAGSWDSRGAISPEQEHNTKP